MDSGKLNGKSDDTSGKVVKKKFDDDLLLNLEDSALFETFGEYIKGRLDLVEVRNDPYLPVMDMAVKDMISDYRANSAKHTDNEKFIKDIFTGVIPEKKILDEISNIKLETGNTDINEITADWVKEWHEKKQVNGGRDSESEKIRDFIKSSLESDINEPEISLPQKEVMGSKRSLLVRYFSFSAAAVIGVFILLKTVLPSADPGKLYNSFYEPFNVISSVTRSATTTDPDRYSTALERYRFGDYQNAAIGFSDVILRDTSVMAPRFFMGVTQLAMGNYQQAVNLLSGIAGRSGEYHKETEWYLGLAYLKTGEKEEAVKCFELLAQLPGFYSERAGKILRRLQ